MDDIFGRRLRELRLARVGSQDLMAARTGFSKGSIQNWEGSPKNPARLPSAANLARLADVLNCSADYLLGRTDRQDLATEPGPPAREPFLPPGGPAPTTAPHRAADAGDDHGGGGAERVA